jgi:hypothetical protein
MSFFFFFFLTQVTDKLYHMMLYRVHVTWAGFELKTKEADRRWLHKFWIFEFTLSLVSDIHHVYNRVKVWCYRHLTVMPERIEWIKQSSARLNVRLTCHSARVKIQFTDYGTTLFHHLCIVSSQMNCFCNPSESSPKLLNLFFCFVLYLPHSKAPHYDHNHKNHD